MESTIPYYRVINRTVAEHMGGLHSAKLLLFSVDFHHIEQFQREEAGLILSDVARKLEAAGAEILVLCTNMNRKVSLG